MAETRIKKKLFGGEMEVIIEDLPEELAIEIVDEMYLGALRLQKIFNFYDPNSELSLLNKERTLEVSKELLFVLKKALEICKKTKGLYDIALGKEFLKRKSGENIEKQTCSYKDISIIGNKVCLTDKKVLIDLGSIAKGYITDKLAEFLTSKGVLTGLIDSRGDIFIFGENEREIEIQDPRKAGAIGKLIIKNSGVATSGDYKQYDRSFEKSHILNQKEIISVTVVAPTLTEADLFATAIFVTPENKIKALINTHPLVKVLYVNKEGRINMYNKFEEIYKNEN